MYSKLAHQQYVNLHITTVDRGRLLVMLYEGCVKFLKHAKVGLESKDYPKFATFLSKSQAIIVELINTLDFEKGGEIARDLEKIYEFTLYYLTEANIQRDPVKVERVISIIEKISAAYKEIVETNSHNETTEKTDQSMSEGSIRIAL